MREKSERKFYSEQKKEKNGEVEDIYLQKKRERNI